MELVAYCTGLAELVSFAHLVHWKGEAC